MIEQGLSLKDIHSLLATPLWLPRDGIDIDLIQRADHLGSVEIQDVGYAVRSDEFLSRSLPAYISDALRYSTKERRSITW